MLNFKIVIPSINRPHSIRKYTLYFLEKYRLLDNYPVYIFTPQVERYKQVLGNDRFIFIDTPIGLVNARNHIRDYFPEDELLLILDDDIKGVITEVRCLEKEIKKSFAYMLKYKISLGSINPTRNYFFRKNDYLAGLYLCNGCFYFEINKKHPSLYLPCLMSCDEKEDYLNTLNHYLLDGCVFRNDYINVNHTMGKKQGGMADQDRINNNVIACNYIKANYPLLCNIKFKKTRQLEIILRSPLKKYWFPSNDYLKLLIKIRGHLVNLPISTKDSRINTAGSGRSIVFGLTKHRQKIGLHLSKYSKLYPALFNILCQVAYKLKFPFTSIMVNKNYQCNEHIDKNKHNTLNLIIGLGDYTGGELSYNGKLYDIQNRFLIFDGRVPHSVEPFEGTRYSITYFMKA